MSRIAIPRAPNSVARSRSLCAPSHDLGNGRPVQNVLWIADLSNGEGDRVAVSVVLEAYCRRLGMDSAKRFVQCGYSLLQILKIEENHVRHQKAPRRLLIISSRPRCCPSLSADWPRLFTFPAPKPVPQNPSL